MDKIDTMKAKQYLSDYFACVFRERGLSDFRMVVAKENAFAAISTIGEAELVAMGMMDGDYSVSSIFQISIRKDKEEVLSEDTLDEKNEELSSVINELFECSKSFHRTVEDCKSYKNPMSLICSLTADGVIDWNEGENDTWDAEYGDAVFTVSLGSEQLKITLPKAVMLFNLSLESRLFRLICGYDDTQPIYIHTSNPICERQSHKLERSNAVIPITVHGSITRKHLPVLICRDCNRYYLSDETYAEILEIGDPCVKIVSGGNMNTCGWSDQSIYNECGYTVSQAVGLSEDERHDIIDSILQYGIASKEEFIRHLNWLIDRDSSFRNRIARQKWNSDILYIHDNYYNKVDDGEFEEDED